MQNRIIKGRDNPVTVIFSFSGEFAIQGLQGFTEIRVHIDNETYSSNTDRVTVVNKNELRISIGDVTNVAKNRWMLEIVGFNVTYDDGYLLSGACKPVLPAVEVC